MARTIGLIKGMVLSRMRDFHSLNSTFSNNFVVFALVLFGLQPKDNYFLSILIGLLLFIPLCLESLVNVPEERFLLLPLTLPNVLAIRIVGLLLSPPLWIALVLLLVGGARLRWTAYLVIPVAIFVNFAFLFGHWLVMRSPWSNPVRWVPALPGSTGGLVRKNIRELFCTLDIFLALALSLLGTLYRLLTTEPSTDAGFGCSVLIVLACSTYTQSLFTTEGPSGLERYRLMPIRGWNLLLAKDLAFLGILFILTLPHSPVSGLAGGMGALIVGHFASVGRKDMQARWRFTAGKSAGLGLLQVVALFASAILCFRVSPLWLILLAAGLMGSMFFHGRELETQ
jgi:hypothetical protein